MLYSMQTEWDCAMLEIYNMRKDLSDTKKELAHALYQHDAACRVIARLVKENNQLKRELDSSNQKLETMQQNESKNDNL